MTIAIVEWKGNHKRHLIQPVGVGWNLPRGSEILAETSRCIKVSQGEKECSRSGEKEYVKALRKSTVLLEQLKAVQYG